MRKIVLGGQSLTPAIRFPSLLLSICTEGLGWVGEMAKWVSFCPLIVYKSKRMLRSFFSGHAGTVPLVWEVHAQCADSSITCKSVLYS